MCFGGGGGCSVYLGGGGDALIIVFGRCPILARSWFDAIEVHIVTTPIQRPAQYK